MRSVLEKFKIAQPKEFVYGRLSKLNQTFYDNCNKLYLWQNLVDYTDEKTAADLLIKDTDEICFLLWRPSVNNFWRYVKQHDLRIYDFISPALMGLLLKPGELWTPKAVVYDVDMAFELYQSTYRDSALTEQKRRLRQFEEFNELLQYNAAPDMPWFVRSLLTKYTFLA